MARSLCPTAGCHAELEAERIGRAPSIIVGLCPSCSVVVWPGDELQPAPGDFPRSSAERSELEAQR
jgi:hypothetical protein